MTLLLRLSANRKKFEKAMQKRAVIFICAIISITRCQIVFEKGKIRQCYVGESFFFNLEGSTLRKDQRSRSDETKKIKTQMSTFCFLSCNTGC